MKPKDTIKSKIPTRTSSRGQRMITDLLENTDRERKESMDGDSMGVEGEHGKVNFNDSPKERDASPSGIEKSLIGTRSPSGFIITDNTPVILTEPRSSPTEVQDGAPTDIQHMPGEGGLGDDNAEKPDPNTAKINTILTRLDAIGSQLTSLDHLDSMEREFS